MKTFKFIGLCMASFGLLVLAFNVGAAPHEVAAGLSGLAALDHSQLFTGLLMAGTVGNSDAVMKMLDGVEKSLADFQMKAQRELQESGRVSTETKNALHDVQLSQREFADRLLMLEQKRVAGADGGSFSGLSKGWGGQIVNNATFNEMMRGGRARAKFDIQNNTLTGSGNIGGVDRRPGMVPGAFAPLRVEDLFQHFPTDSPLIEYSRENVFTNAAAETAEGGSASESSLTVTLVQQPVSTVTHFMKVSKQLAADNALMAAYINARLMYGVQRRVDAQIVNGNGTAPNMSGLLQTGNFSAHGYTAAQVGTPLPKHRLIRKVIADLRSAGYTPSAILLNPADWLAFDLDLLSSTPAAVSSSDIANGFQQMLFGVPVVETSSVTIDTFAVLDALAAASIFDRQDVGIEVSDSDGDNFTKGLLTVKAERRLALAIEQTGAIRGGDLTPA
ncbi:phage major capsid protein [Methylomonas sp. MK1]|uniref:phage major capsid protein n=1 Tax=Methylomonas sp. MK1 TaxID=1131552 RepID=UPI000378C640|nr:phage major capsid protein [Methylomonas sp. MK1]